jgi:hypothetical protein
MKHIINLVTLYLLFDNSFSGLISLKVYSSLQLFFAKFTMTTCSIALPKGGDGSNYLIFPYKNIIYKFENFLYISYGIQITIKYIIR